MKNWKLLPTLLALILCITTWIIVFLTASIGTRDYYGGVYYYSGSYTFDMPLGAVTFLACLLLIVAFVHGKPQCMYRGLQAYILLVGILSCYIVSANGRIVIASIPLLPNFADPLVLVCLLLTLVASLLLMLLRTKVLHIFALLSSLKEKPVWEREKPRSYQAGYQAHHPNNREQATRRKRNSGTIATHVHSYEQFEQPQTSYPQVPEMDM